MEKLKYAETAIEQVHIKTFRGDLPWQCSRDRVSADPTPGIRVSIRFDDEGTNSAIWERVVITHPVGEDITMLGNPSSAKSGLCQLIAAGQTLDRVNEIFCYVLLDPREREFEAAMKELRK